MFMMMMMMINRIQCMQLDY